jgi:hypothetical protein
VAFETVWHDLQVLQGQTKLLQPLAGQATSEVREVADEGVWLYLHAIGRERLVSRESLAAAWSLLIGTGRLVPRDQKIHLDATTLLAHLPYVEYSLDPVTLYFPAQVPHPLGTLRRRDLTV